MTQRHKNLCQLSRSLYSNYSNITLPGGISAAVRSSVWEMMVPVEGNGSG